jgi:acetoacetyl-CoA synthetase
MSGNIHGGANAAQGPAVLWEPSAAFNERATFASYLAWLERERALRFTADDQTAADAYLDTWSWSVREIEQFWASVWDFFEVRASRPYEQVLPERRMPGARWFPGAALNYAEHVFRNEVEDRPALLVASERGGLAEVGWAELRRQVAAIAHALREMGVGPGDRVAGYLPNIPQAVVAFLACASIGAVWSSCSPDFGAQGVAERFRQIEPRVLIAVDGYRYGGRAIDRLGLIEELRKGLPSLRQAVIVPYLDPARASDAARTTGAILWSELLRRDAPLEFHQVPFDHPLWVLYSSGTTGLPKAMVQGHGGILLEHLKALALQCDVKREDRLFWFTTTGWMMWNLLIGGLLVGCTCVLYDGNPMHPDPDALWRLAQDARITRFGTSAAYLGNCMKAGLRPGDRFDLSALRAIGSTGSPLPPEAYRWVYDAVKRDVWLASTSGGTDVCSSFLSACPFMPVRAGELQGPALGVSVRAFDPSGRELIDEVGELVITEPMPSMPVFFWNDPDGVRYRESYFEMFPGVWRHGDWVRISPRGGAVIYGRSDSTLNRQGVRIGTSEIYRAVEAVPEVLDSVVVGLETPGGGYSMPLFVVLRAGVDLDEGLAARIRQQIRARFTARHVPDAIVQVPSVPRTLNGKKLEVPVKRILMGEPVARVVNPGSLANPESLEFFVRYAARGRETHASEASAR